MKRFILIAFCCLFLLSFFGCGGTYGEIDLQEPVAIPEDGIIRESVIRKLREENAIGTFQGSSNGFSYEWTIFGSDITEAREINLKTEITALEDGVGLRLSQTEPFGFPALLSVELQEVWDAQSATAYQENKAVYSVTLTGSRNTIANLSVGDVLGSLRIVPDASVEITPAPTAEPEDTKPLSNADGYLSAVNDSSTRVYSDGKGTGKDKYQTDPIPEGKPLPVEPENQQVNTANSYTCTFSIECSTILNNLSQLDPPSKLEVVPSGGTILAPTTVTFYEGESVFDVLQRLCQEKGIHMEASWTPIYNSAYVEGIHNLYEFDCGSLSGWMYRVNGWYPNYGCSRYSLEEGDVVEWRYTCDLGNDVGGRNLFG